MPNGIGTEQLRVREQLAERLQKQAEARELKQQRLKRLREIAARTGVAVGKTIQKAKLPKIKVAKMKVSKAQRLQIARLKAEIAQLKGQRAIRKSKFFRSSEEGPRRPSFLGRI